MHFHPWESAWSGFDVADERGGYDHQMVPLPFQIAPKCTVERL